MFTVMIVLCLLKSMFIPSFVLIGCCVSELHGHLCPYRNVLPEAVFYKNYIVFQIVYMFLWSELEVVITSPSFIASGSWDS